MTEPNFLYYMDNFNQLLNEEWKVTVRYPSKQKDLFGELLSVFDKDGDGKISNTEAQSLWSMAQEAAAEMGDPNALETEEADKLVSKLKLNLTGEEFISVVAQLRDNVFRYVSGIGNQPEVNTPMEIKKEDMTPGSGISPCKKYTKENLEMLYPKDKYDIKETQVPGKFCSYSIIEKSSGKPVALYEINLKNQFACVEYLSEGNYEFYSENASGNIDYYENDEPTVERLQKLLNGGEVTVESLGLILKNLESPTILVFLDQYKARSKNGSSLIKDITNAQGLSTAAKKVFIIHIFQQVLKYAKENGVYINDLEVKFNEEIMNQSDRWFSGMNVDYLDVFLDQLKRRIQVGAPAQDSLVPANGKIDADFKQGNYTGDCWLLAPIKSIASTPKGLKILNDSIKVNNDGSVDVTLKGPGKTYHITKAELYGSTELSTGDADVRALEIAVEKFFEEERGSSDTNGRLDIVGNLEYIAYEILTGQAGWDHFYGEYSMMADLLDVSNRREAARHNPTDEEINNINKPNVITTVSVASNSISNKHLVRQGGQTLSDFTCQTVKGNTVRLYANHAYSVIRTSGNNVYLVNPHDTSDEIIMPKSQFKEFFEHIYQHELV